MISAELTYEIGRLEKACQLYGGLSNKTESEVVQKQGTKLSFNIKRRLRGLAPAKGSIRAERVAAMKTGRGTHVRQAVMEYVEKKYNLVPFSGLIRKSASGREAARMKRIGMSLPAGEASRSVMVGGHRMNLRALAVQRELAVRESGRGFMSVSTPIPGEEDSGTRDVVGRYGHLLSEFVMSAAENAETKYALLRWVDGKGTALEGVTKDRQINEVTAAVQETTADVMKYVDGKFQQIAKRTGF